LAAADPARAGTSDLLLARRPVRHDPSLPDQGRGPLTETVTRIKIALPSAFSSQTAFVDLAGLIAKLPP
jgi:hypothetical protein